MWRWTWFGNVMLVAGESGLELEAKGREVVALVVPPRPLQPSDGLLGRLRLLVWHRSRDSVEAVDLGEVALGRELAAFRLEVLAREDRESVEMTFPSVMFGRAEIPQLTVPIDPLGSRRSAVNLRPGFAVGLLKRERVFVP